MKITNLTAPLEIDVKRFYVPCRVEDECPACGQLVARDEDDYLAYPTANVTTELNFYHGGCPNRSTGPNSNPAGTEWSRYVILRITLEAVQ